MIQQTIIDMKDWILQSIDVESDVVAIRNIEKIVHFLELASGFFVEAHYCYKAVEMCNRCDLRLAAINSDKTLLATEELRRQLQTLKGEYFEAHQSPES